MFEAWSTVSCEMLSLWAGGAAPVLERLWREMDAAEPA